MHVPSSSLQPGPEPAPWHGTGDAAIGVGLASGPHDSLLHVRCPTCGYPLAGLPLGGVCPECGMPVMHALRGRLLRYASPDYLWKVRLGLTLAAVVLLASMVWTILTAVLVEVLGVGAGAELFGHLSYLLLSGVSLAGYWLATTPDPAIVGMREPAGARLTVRVCVAVQVVGTLGALIMMLLHQWGPADQIEVVLAFVGGLAWLVQIPAAMVYCGFLAQRGPDMPLGAYARKTAWLSPVLVVGASASCACMLPTMAGIMMAAGSAFSQRGGAPPVAGWVGIVLGVAILLTWLGVVIYAIFRYAKMLIKTRALVDDALAFARSEPRGVPLERVGGATPGPARGTNQQDS